MEKQDMSSLFPHIKSVEERGMGESFDTLDTDPAHHSVKLQAEPPARTTGGLDTSTEPHIPGFNRDSISWDTLARVNALAKYGKCSLFVKNEGVYKQLVELHTPAPYLRATIAEVNFTQRSANIEPLLILTLWNNHRETCDRVNALLKFGRVNCYAMFQEDMYTVTGIHPLVGNDWIEHITSEGERLHIVKKYYDPLYLKL